MEKVKSKTELLCYNTLLTFLKIAMVEIFYSSINSLKDHEIIHYLQVLPSEMRKEILRNKLIEARKAKLIGRLMLLHQLNCSKSGYSLEDWELDKAKKPFIKNWNNFNISHSGEFVVLCISTHMVGIDIEQIKDLEDFFTLSAFFTLDEKRFVANSSQPAYAFYEIWVKKEAYLKAVGIGLSIKLDSFSCLGQMISFNNLNFSFTQLFIHPGYICFLCCDIPVPMVTLKQFHINDLVFT